MDAVPLSGGHDVGRLHGLSGELGGAVGQFGAAGGLGFGGIEDGGNVPGLVAAALYSLVHDRYADYYSFGSQRFDGILHDGLALAKLVEHLLDRGAFSLLRRNLLYFHWYLVCSVVHLQWNYGLFAINIRK